MDRKLPPRRLNPLAAAATGEAIAAAARAGLAAEASFQQQLREANLKIPIKDAIRDLAGQMQESLDAQLKIAVERFLGFEVTDPEQVAGRLTHQQPQTEALRQAAQGEACTIYSMDGVPILRAGPQELERQGDSIHAYQLVEQLLPEDFKPGAAGGIIVP